MDLHNLLSGHVPDALSIHDLEGHYLWASPAFAELLGVTPGGLVGRDFFRMVHPEDVEAVTVTHQALLHQPTSNVVKFRMERGDGLYRWVEATARVSVEDDVIVASTRPIDHRHSVLNALEAERLLAARLREFDNERHLFLTTVSHRARQPLTVISAMAELLSTRWRDLDPEQVDVLLARARHNTKELQKLVDDVTRAEELARGARAVQARPVDLRRLVNGLVDRVASPDGPIEVDIPAGTVVVADHDLLRVAIAILLDNAAVHTPVGTPVWVRMERVGEGAMVIVEDAGPGVEPSRRASIFDTFVSGEADAHDPGLGLGLNVVAQVAVAHHGRVWVEDRAGGGASFRMLIPPAIPTVVDVGPLDPELDQEKAPERPTRVLVVDDDPNVSLMLQVALEADGYMVATVDNGADAIREVEGTRPDVVVLDVLMPGLGGHEVTRAIRSNPDTCRTPIVMCSALGTEDDRWQAHIAGADAFVAKPFDIRTLTAELTRAQMATRSVTD